MASVGIHRGVTTSEIEVLNDRDLGWSGAFVAAISHEPIRDCYPVVLNGRFKPNKLFDLLYSSGLSRV